MLVTVTVTATEVVVFPAASRATAVKVCEPLATDVVFHETEYGAVVSSVPRLAPSSRNCTPTTPTLSAAVAVTVIVPLTVAPLAGDVRLTVGGVLSFDTVTVTAADVVTLPAASRATAVRLCDPLVAVVVFHGTEYGAAVSSVPMLAPSRRNCTPTTPTLSAAVAVTVTVPLTVAPLAGDVSAVVGGTVSGGSPAAMAGTPVRA